MTLYIAALSSLIIYVALGSCVIRPFYVPIRSHLLSCEFISITIWLRSSWFWFRVIRIDSSSSSSFDFFFFVSFFETVGLLSYSWIFKRLFFMPILTEPGSLRSACCASLRHSFLSLRCFKSTQRRCHHWPLFWESLQFFLSFIISERTRAASSYWRSFSSQSTQVVIRLNCFYRQSNFERKWISFSLYFTN